jgi:hypothetical protein
VETGNLSTHISLGLELMESQFPWELNNLAPEIYKKNPESWGRGNGDKHFEMYKFFNQ